MLGVCYYPEHWPEELWADDARRMVELGIRYVRIGEFAWSRIEPARGQFRWDWLDRAIATLADAGLQVVMCTPTATPPKWLVDERPEILAYDAEERPRRFGSRRHYCFASPAWREETVRICEAVAVRYGEHPAVVGWQLDNEYGCHDTVLSYAPHCRSAFQDWLRARYITIGSLNDAWGAAFWSQELSDFAAVDPPNLTVTEANPAHRLDYRRFCSDQVAGYNRLQTEIVRRHAPERFVTHNFMGFFTEFDHAPVAAELDLVAWDSYPLGFTNQRMGLADQDRIRFARSGHPDAAAFNHDRCRGLGAGGRFWIMEHQPGPVNWAPYNPAPAPGMVRLWSLEAFAHGAEVVSYFRWRQARFAQEQMHAGLLRPDGALDTGGEEAARVAEEIAALGIEREPPGKAPVALVFSEAADWALGIQPQGANFSYLQLVLTFYGALRRLAVDVDVLPPTASFEGYPLMVVPTLPVVDEATTERFAQSGGTVVFGPRSGSRDPDHRIPETLPPGALQTRLPLSVTRVESLPPGLVDQVAWGNRHYQVERWRERIDSRLTPSAVFVDGGGAVYQAEGWHYLGFWPDDAFLQDFVARLLAEAQVPTRVLSDTLRVRRRGALTFAFNYGEAAVATPAPPNARFVLGGRNLPAHEVAVWRDR